MKLAVPGGNSLCSGGSCYARLYIYATGSARNRAQHKSCEWRMMMITGHQPSAIVLPESDVRFDQELVRWFALHGGVWSGTAAELLAAVRTRSDVGSDLWPQSPRTLYAHIDSHIQVLRSLGLDVWVRHGNPRLISLQRCQNEKPARKLSDTRGINRITYDSSIGFSPPAADQKMSSADGGEIRPLANETVGQDIAIATSDLAERFLNGERADGDHSDGCVFENPGKALFAILEMRGRIREQGLDIKSAIDLVVGRTQEITRCSGVAVGLLEQNGGVYSARAGIAVTSVGLNFQANFFQSCLTTGEAVQLPDAQKDPVVGATCRREGIGSLIIVPIFHNREVAGAMEFVFKEVRSFLIVDVMDLELIAGIVSERLNGAAEIELKHAKGRKWPARPNTVQNLAPQVGHSLNEKAGLVDALLSPSEDTITATSLSKPAIPESSRSNTISKSATALTLLWLALKRVWMRSIRSM